ncbi:Crp/Fnr family transcriptional regulator [Polaribacter sp. Hel_I_88]|uniref:Crp/Fnr family transcriptional regulator n=1 Tax=Polaribacter sp. Hel_I_88 TaxID=1250006 RepID=UPI00047DE6A7|nr:Crp/Fnr family transcriptional regulator [Polaribacter sp. Hel_I_88]
MEFLKNFTESFGEIPKTSVQQLVDLAKEVSLKKGEIISKIGQISNSFYIIKTGVVRSYYQDEKGKQYIRTIFTDNRATGCLSSLITEETCKLNYQCLTDCLLYEINFKEFKKQVKKDHHIAILYNRMLESIFLIMESRIHDLSVLDATERYLKLKKEISNIEELITQYHIASYLNISPVQLSRIRKEIYSK